MALFCCLLGAAALANAAVAGATTPSAAGTWSCCGAGGAGEQTWTITESGGTLSGSGPSIGPINGSISGTSVTITTGPYTSDPGYEATFVGTISGETMSGTWKSNVGQEGTWTATRTSGPPNEEEAKKAEEAKKKKEEEEKKGKRASATSVTCYYEFLTTIDVCTAQVGDASGQQPAKIPTGSVAFTINPGGVGGFQGASTCAPLVASQTGGASSFCAVDYKSPSLEVPIGQQPPITATYSGDSNFTASSSSPKSVKGENPLEEIPELCLATGVNCEGIDLTLPTEPTIDELDETELSLGCYDPEAPTAPANDASAASAHTSPSAHASFLAYTSPFAHISSPSVGNGGITMPTTPPLTPPKSSAICKIQAQIEATKKAQAKAAKKLDLLKQQLDVQNKLEPLNQKKQQLEKALKEVSEAWGNEEPEAVEASIASRKHKLAKPAIPFGTVTVEVPDHDRRNVKLVVPKSDQIFVTVLRDAHISVLHLQIRITVVRTGDKKATSFIKTVTYQLSKK